MSGTSSIRANTCWKSSSFWILGRLFDELLCPCGPAILRFMLSELIWGFAHADCVARRKCWRKKVVLDKQVAACSEKRHGRYERTKERVTRKGHKSSRHLRKGDNAIRTLSGCCILQALQDSLPAKTFPLLEPVWTQKNYERQWTRQLRIRKASNSLELLCVFCGGQNRTSFVPRYPHARVKANFV